MTNLTNYGIAQAYGDLLTTTNGGQGLTTVPQQLQDGMGNASTITIATDTVNFNRQGGNEFQLDGVALTADAADINEVCSDDPVIGGVGGIVIPSGTTAQRLAIQGSYRFNTDTGRPEIYSGAVWIVL